MYTNVFYVTNAMRQGGPQAGQQIFKNYPRFLLKADHEKMTI